MAKSVGASLLKIGSFTAKTIVSVGSVGIELANDGRKELIRNSKYFKDVDKRSIIGNAKSKKAKKRAKKLRKYL